MTPLKPGQVLLLKRGGQFDISQKVKTVVQRHFGYQGTEEFRANFTKDRITFTLKNNPDTESRTLVLQNSHWMLSQNGATPTALDSRLENEVNTLVTEILSKIGQASHTNVPDPVPETNATASIEGEERTNDSELTDVKARLAILETRLGEHLTLEESLRTQKEILREITHLRDGLARGPKDGTVELKKVLEEKEKQLKELQSRAEEEIGKMKEAVEAERQQMTDQLGLAKKNLRDAQAKAEQEIGKLQEQITKLQEAQQQNKQTFEALDKKHKEALAAQEKQSVLLKKKENLLEAAQKEHQNQQQQIAKLEAELKDHKIALELGLVGLKTALVQKEQIQENAEREVKSLETEIKKLNSQIFAHEKLLALANNQLPSLQGEVLFEQDKRLKAEKEIKCLKSEKAALQEQITKLQGDARIELHSRMDAASKQSSAAFVTMVKGLEQTKSLNETKKKLDDTQIELRKQHEYIGKLEADLKTLKAQLDAAQTTAETKDKIAAAQFTQLQDDYSELTEEHDLALEALKTLQTLNKDMEATLEAAAKDGERAKVAATELKTALALKEEELQKTSEAAEQARAETEKEKQRASQSNLQRPSDHLEKVQLDNQQTPVAAAPTLQTQQSRQESMTALESSSKVQNPPLLIPIKYPAPRFRKKATVNTVTPTQQRAKEIQKLDNQVAKVNNGRIATKYREDALQNYIFLLFVQEKNIRNEPILMEKFNPSDLSDKDKILLEEVAAKAMQKMDPKATSTYDLKKLLESKDRNTKIKALQSVKQELGQTDNGMAKLEGKAREILEDFYLSLYLNSKSLNQNNNYKDFLFAKSPFLAADLQIAKEIYEECRAYYEKTTEPNDPQLLMIEEKVGQLEEDQRLLEEVQRLFLVFLEKCQVV